MGKLTELIQGGRYREATQEDLLPGVCLIECKLEEVMKHPVGADPKSFCRVIKLDEDPVVCTYLGMLIGYDDKEKASSVTNLRVLPISRVLHPGKERLFLIENICVS